MAQRTTVFAEIDGILHVHHRETDWTEPRWLNTYWSIGIKVSQWERDNLIGKPAYRSNFGAGRYTDHWGTGYSLVNGGKTVATKIEFEPYPCPKVRKGIETRYYYGWWEKHLKSRGWVKIYGDGREA